MAREETDREDLLREATALVERIELAPAEPGSDERVVVGFRGDGAMTIYFGAEPVYQFNTADQLRRAHCDGWLFKAVRGRLVRLERVRRQGQVQLVRHELTGNDEAAFVARMRDRLSDFARRLDAGRAVVVGQVPADRDVLERVRKWLADHDGLPIAKTPHVRAATREHCG